MATSMVCHRSLLILRRNIKRHIFRSLATSSNESKDTTDSQKTTHFGFQTVTEDEKEEKVHAVFRNVADKYDLMNDAMSVGVHRLWKDHFIRRLSPRPNTKLIDVAGGTGDIAFRFLQYINSLHLQQTEGSDYYDIDIPRNIQTEAFVDTQDSSSSSESDNSSDEDTASPGYQRDSYHVTVCDINQAMLDVGKERAAEAGIMSGISWLKGNAECLPVADNTYDAYTIAFGIRNCTHIDKVVEEAYRVLKPGGRFMCLEFSHVPNSLLRRAYDEYSFQVIPVMGQILAADWDSYQYLVESIRQFPNQEDFKDLIKSCGFKFVTYENMTFGICAIHSGFKL